MDATLATATNNPTTLATIPGSSPVPTKAPSIPQSQTDALKQFSIANSPASQNVTNPNFGFASDQTPQTPKPTTIVSSQPATDKLNNTIVPAMQAGNTAVQQQAQTQAAAKTNVPPPVQTPAPVAPETPNEGNQYAYDTQGNKIEVPQGQNPPAGYSTTKPANPTLNGKSIVGDQVTGPDGSTYVQYNDGTYGKLNADGSFANIVNSSAYNNAYNSDPSIQMRQTVNALSNLNSGSIPLNPVQQTQINAIQQQLQQSIADQQQANANFTGGTTLAMNLYGMGNSLYGKGMVQASINAGIAAITKLQTAAASAIAKMTGDFQQQNYTDMANHYKDMINAQTAIQTHIDNLQSIAEQHAKDIQTNADNLRTFNLEVQKDQEAQQQLKVSNALAQQTADRENALAKSTMAVNAAQIKKINNDISQANLAGGIGVMGGSTLGTDGSVDPTKQAAFLQQIAAKDPGMAQSIKAAAEYRLPLTAAFFKSTKGMAFANLMLQYNPNWDANNYVAKAAAVKDFSSGKNAQAVVALNTAIQHLHVLTQDTQKLGNANLPLYNPIKNTLGGMFGVTPTAGVKVAIAGETGELSKAFTGLGATDTEQKALGTVNQDSSPADVKAYAQNVVDLLSGKLNALNDQYIAQVGQPPASPLLRADTMTQLSNLKNDGFTVDIPGVLYTDPKAYAANTPNAAQNLSTARQQLIAANDPNNPPTPENILQMAQIINQ